MTMTTNSIFPSGANRRSARDGAKDSTPLRSAARAALIGGALLALAACNTVQGVGRDIESVGKKGDEVLTGD